MKWAISIAVLLTVFCLVFSAAIDAQLRAAEAKPPAAKPSEAEKPELKPAASERPALDQDALSKWAQTLAKMRQQKEGNFLKVGDVCEVKHYKQDTLQGFGLVLDLEELAKEEEKETTGIEAVVTASTAVQLTELVQLLNKPVGEQVGPAAVPPELMGKAKLTLVAVTAAVPPEGVRDGDRIDCEVRAFDATSLENCYLLATELSAPGPRKDAALAVAAGPITRESSVVRGASKVTGGCLAQADICDQFLKDDKITLILDPEHADFQVAQDIVNKINVELGMAVKEPLAKALNRFNVEVAIPSHFADDPVAFVTMLLQLDTQIPAPEKKESPFRTRGGP